MLKLIPSITLVFLLGFYANLAYPQSKQAPVRYELPIGSGYATVNKVDMGEKGLCLIYPTTETTAKDSTVWAINYRNSNLENVWVINITFGKNVKYIYAEYDQLEIYFLFHDVKESENDNLLVYAVNADSLTSRSHTTKIPDNSQINSVLYNNGIFWLSYHKQKYGTGIIGVGANSNFTKNIIFQNPANTIVLDISPNYSKNGFWVVYKENEKNNHNTLFCSQYTNSGTQISTQEIKTSHNWKFINSAQFVATSDNSGLIAGSYGYNDKDSRRPTYNDYYYSYYNPFFYRYNPYYYRSYYNYDANTDNTPVSEGFFAVSRKNNRFDSIRYYPFGNFTDSYKYITDQEAIVASVKSAKTDKQDTRNKKSAPSLQLRLIMHDLYYADNQLIVVAESYLPEYRSRTTSSYDYYGGLYPNTYYVFDGFRYSNAFIAGFDSDANMIWNNGIEMNDILTPFLNKKLNLLFNADEIVLFYNANAKIAYKSIIGAEQAEPISYTKIQSRWNTDKLNEEYKGSIEYWYDDFFIVSGYQKIYNDYMHKSDRHVFYLQKMAFR